MNRPRVIVRSLTLRSIPVIAFVLGVVCSRSPYNPDLGDYFKAEKELRTRVALERQLLDSLAVLQSIYGIDPQVEFSRLHDHPESWIDLIEELRRER